MNLALYKSSYDISGFDVRLHYIEFTNARFRSQGEGVTDRKRETETDRQRESGTVRLRETKTARVRGIKVMSQLWQQDA